MLIIALLIGTIQADKYDDNNGSELFNAMQYLNWIDYNKKHCFSDINTTEEECLNREFTRLLTFYEKFLDTYEEYNQSSKEDIK